MDIGSCHYHQSHHHSIRKWQNRPEARLKEDCVHVSLRSDFRPGLGVPDISPRPPEHRREIPRTPALAEFQSRRCPKRGSATPIRSLPASTSPESSSSRRVPPSPRRTVRRLQIGRSTRLNSSHQIISYAAFSFKKKNHQNTYTHTPRHT